MQQLLNYIKGDRVIWFVALLLALVSVIAVYGSIVTLAYKYHDGNTEYYLFKHTIMIVTGFMLMYYAHKLKFKYYSRVAQIAIWASVVLLVMTLAFGANINHASRWLTIPIINQNFQTSDFAKIALVLYVARVLSQKQDEVKDFKKTIVPLLIPIALICGLILPANFSTAAMLFLTCMVLLFVGRVPMINIGKVVGLAIAGFMLLVSISFVNPELMPRIETWKSRVASWFTGEEDMQLMSQVEQDAMSQSKFQSEQAIAAIRDGGMLPTGPAGSSRNTLPHPYSDMIYAYIIQSYGSILGGFGVLLLYLILFFRSIRVARECDKAFGSLVAVGLSFMLILQALINMSVSTNVIPVTGQPLPLVSMGGTSTWFTCLAIGIILSVSRSGEPDEDEESSSKSGNHVVA
jgi:cell division protein FtsW